MLKTHIINYAKTREVYDGYRKAGYSKKYLAENERDILLHKAAKNQYNGEVEHQVFNFAGRGVQVYAPYSKNAFDEQGLKKLPMVKALQEEYAELLAEKKAAYAEYRAARDEMKALVIHRANVEQILRMDLEREKNEHNRW